MTPKSKHQRQTLRAEGRASQLSRDAQRSKTRRKAKGKAGRKGDRGRMTRRRSSPWRRLAVWTLLAVLVGPALVILVYRVLPPPVTPLMLIRAQEGEEIDYRWTPLERISPHLAHAVIASEDNRFCEHWGFDFGEFLEIFDAWQEGERPRGASTITMQTAKNILLWPERQVVRKLLEAWLTPQLELIWNKRRILEVYLNVAEMGPGIYGAEAAAQRHFGKPAAALTPREAALLAAA
ncbi:MAG: monofunctional biosynthetic peptidoglycan transglycosylase, partial [Kiloniellales bacterium]|nr:monofunctional biosynthetic peptidoglycan transglycosylase [Kiloniellales bacterium]